MKFKPAHLLGIAVAAPVAGSLMDRRGSANRRGPRGQYSPFRQSPQALAKARKAQKARDRARDKAFTEFRERQAKRRQTYEIVWREHLDIYADSPEEHEERLDWIKRLEPHNRDVADEELGDDLGSGRFTLVSVARK